MDHKGNERKKKKLPYCKLRAKELMSKELYQKHSTCIRRDVPYVCASITRDERQRKVKNRYKRKKKKMEFLI